MKELLLPCGFDTLEYSWVKATIGICTLANYFVAKKYQPSSTTTLCTISPPLAMNSSNTNQEKNKILYMRFKISVLHKAYKQVFKELYTPLCQDLQRQE
jgi:hypothetical protein